MHRDGGIYRHNDPTGAACAASHQSGIDLLADLAAKQADGGEQAQRSELVDWWMDLARIEVDAVVAKAIEYGATDLRDLGLQILEMAGRRGPNPTDDGYATEIGIAFYAIGKMARIAAAVKEGRRPSLDSWSDLGVYARMAQRVRVAGAWPGVGIFPVVPKEQEEVPTADG
jgi:hypothetical protein